MSKCLDCGEAFADQRGIPHAKLLQARLYDDMMTLTGQVQRASDAAKRAATGLAHIQNVVMEDSETSFQQLRERIALTVALLESTDCSEIELHARDLIAPPNLSGMGPVVGQSYIQNFALPNFFFHVAIAYGILRSQGVPLGKRHYLGWDDPVG